MPKVVANKLLELVKRSGLVEDEQIEKFLTEVASSGQAEILDDVDKLADRFVSEKLVTRWQADQLLVGKHKGFLLGKYRLLSQIGKGGMSSVYLAQHILMRRQVAIKVLPTKRVNDASYLDRFRLEARAVAKLDDPHIVRAFDIDNEGNVHYIVMEYVEGQDLHQLVNASGPLDFVTAADYIAQVASGLQHAHEMGLIHRDIKPANCLVDKQQTVKLLDMGLAKLTDDEDASLTMANEENVLGTADYLSPEQAINSHKADARSDIYSLGCTLYFLLTGRPPFPEGTISERLLKHQVETPESILKSRADAPPSLVKICERMMHKIPESRYQTSEDVNKLLVAWLAERGRKIRGRRITEESDGSGVGSGVFARFAIPPAGVQKKIDPCSSETLANEANSDTDPLIKEDSGVLQGADEEIGLAPLDEEEPHIEATLSGIGSKSSSSLFSSEESSSKNATNPSASAVQHSLIEEEFAKDRLDELPNRGLDNFNPLHPPGYSGPSTGISLETWLVIGAVMGLVGVVTLAIKYL